VVFEMKRVRKNNIKKVLLDTAESEKLFGGDYFS